MKLLWDVVDGVKSLVHLFYHFLPQEDTAAIVYLLLVTSRYMCCWHVLINK